MLSDALASQLAAQTGEMDLSYAAAQASRQRRVNIEFQQPDDLFIMHQSFFLPVYVFVYGFTVFCHA